MRLPRELVTRLDAHVEQERKRTGYASLTRKDVVSRILDQALRAAEGRK